MSVMSAKKFHLFNHGIIIVALQFSADLYTDVIKRNQRPPNDGNERYLGLVTSESGD